ncbi:MAG: arsenate reductase (glutaredoxin) [Verrucomicrobia bacterium]|nr:arsenate reductase (glutaredoxin) [Verrucomicrobiota bacterium]
MKTLKTSRSAPLTIYHNPKCSKSREVLALLRERGVEPVVVEYLKSPLTSAQLSLLLQMLGIKPHALLRTKEDEYREFNLSPASPEAEIINILAAHPVLMERPVVVVGKRAVIGRPPGKVLELLSPPAKLRRKS